MPPGKNAYMQAIKIWRWLALFSVIANVLFNYAYAADGTMTVVTDTYLTVFRPAGYAFSIWSIIYLGQIAYAVYALLPSQRNITQHGRQVVLLSVSSALSIVWIIAFTGYYITASELIIISMLAFALALLRNAMNIVRGSSAGKWLVLVPFSMYAAWLSVATIANTFIWVKSMGWSGSAAQEQLWAIVLVIVAGVIGLAVALRDKNPFFPLVIGWASLALYVQQQHTYPPFANTALAVSIAMLLISVYEFMQRWPERKMAL
jgi:benzodiazapine receptor